VRDLQVTPRDGESFESLLRRFKTGVEKEGVLREFRRRQRFVSKSQEERAKAKKAARRHQLKASRRAA
jgi:small subunit ribosomal protein S21